MNSFIKNFMAFVYVSYEDIFTARYHNIPIS